ncbi:hypothetical protein GCM10020331_022460 [Ectobacillus funiculus]
MIEQKKVNVDQLSINTIRTLSIDAIEKGWIWSSGNADGRRTDGLYTLGKVYEL